MPRKTSQNLLALLAVGALAVAALAVPVAAQADGGDDRPREKARERMEEDRERREKMREHREELRDRYQDKCADPANETVAERCERARDFGNHAFKARREAHALLGAIDALEHRIAMLEVKELRVRTALADGNLTANETADLEAKLVRIDNAQQEMAAKLARLYEKLEALKEKWAAVRDHVEERRGHGQEKDDGDEDGDDGEPSPTPSPSPSPTPTA